jgi:ATP-dependent Clp protease ATP-binding subunit ClpX
MRFETCSVEEMFDLATKHAEFGTTTILPTASAAPTEQYVKMFEIDGVKLKFEDDVLDYVVDKAVEFGLGARGLRSLIETIMMEAMFEVPSTGVKTYKVTLEYAQRRVENANIAVLKESTEDR